MANQAQIDADAALARRLQEEEFAPQVGFSSSPRTRPSREPPQPHPSHPRREDPPASNLPFPLFPFAQGRAGFDAHDMLTEFFNRVGEPNTLDTRLRAREQAMEGLEPLGGARYMRPQRDYGDRARANPRSPRTYGARARPDERGAPAQPPPPRGWSGPPPEVMTPERMMQTMFNSAFGGFEGGGGESSFVGGSFVISPDGVARFETTNRRPAQAADAHQQRGSRQQHQQQPRGRAGDDRNRARGRPGAPPGGDIGDMFNLMFNGMLGGEQGGAGMAPSMVDWIRSVLPTGGMTDSPETYEDWLALIERMGGNVNRGATDEEIGSIPTRKFRKDPASKRKKRDSGAGSSSSSRRSQGARGAAEEEADKCAICLGEYEQGEDVKELPCTHLFHAECISRWLRVNKTCPFCKQSIRPESGSGASRRS